AFTSATTLGPNAWGRNYNGHSVTVLKEAVTLRAGQTYKYVQVKDLTANKTYWIDERAVLGTITSTKSVSYQAIINDASRNDWLLNDGPALTSWSTLASNGSGAAYDGHIVTVIQQATTTRGDGQTYTYYQVKDTTANKTYWIDARGVSAKTINLITTGLLATQQTWLYSIVGSSVNVANVSGLYASIMVAQAILESGWGSSMLASVNHNLFGIKANGSQYANGTVTYQTGEYINGSESTISGTFNNYASAEYSFLDYANTMNKAKYANVSRSVAGSYQQAAQNLSDDGYATDPEYADHLISIIQQYDLQSLD
ncbi:glucosaminidase domain-containing protein, partial [Oenococcus sicerae]